MYLGYLSPVHDTGLVEATEAQLTVETAETFGSVEKPYSEFQRDAAHCPDIVQS